jgi:hypothetical protein
LYNFYGEPTIELDEGAWKPLFDGWMDMSRVKRVVTELAKAGKIDKTHTHLTIRDTKRRIKKEPKEEPEEEGEPNDLWEMAVVICEVVGQNPKFFTPKRYLRFAKELVQHGYSREYIRDRYGEGGWWYATQYKGQRGSPPNVSDIRKTIDKEGTPRQQKTDPSVGFFTG